MSFTTAILKHAPSYWDNFAGEETRLSPYNEEFKQIAFEVRYALSQPTRPISNITRIQNVHDLGQVLLREQLLVVANQYRTYYRVRRFIKVKKNYLKDALKYNLDHRRCNLQDLVFSSLIPHYCFTPDDVLFVVQVVTSEPNSAEVRPSNNLEYFIDYVVEF